MSLLPILTIPDTRLKAKCKPLTNVDGRVATLMDDMLETMYKAPGIGLAAPQIGLLERVIVVDVSENRSDALAMVNPELIWTSDEQAITQEGCLSIPEIYAEVTRPKMVRVRYVDRGGEVREMDADGLLATCIQHEIDHLNGVLFIDHLSSLKRNMLLRKYNKAKK
ncbi:peptide deformylase [Niveispirillum cyanobacteriorum]|uniref:Peptide deformylase n=1 Tax=Niveispirillum cyanobacteriorum TaxID=1612173 RepID=A0A2K9NFK8_9PROT|nr:peptide deformylase [Niveispirillum cyanobacteriorum]AUN31888.1 peptide deformylase [Niveispirillum cyanobacteriorum]